MEFLADNHPRVIHFAIAFLFVYPLFELMALVFKKEYLDKSAHLILFIAVLSAIGAVLTGNQAEKVAFLWEEQGAIIPFGLLNEHREYANITLWYFTALLLFRTLLVTQKKFSSTFRYVIVILAFIGTYFVYQTGEYGGELVYKHGVGTELKKQEIEDY
jgi:uncharacterized membrane protein